MKYITTASAAEQNAAVQMRVLGFSDARVTKSGADGGIDVRATGAVAQVKWRAGQVGRPDLQRLFGARGNRFELQLLFFAAAPYSAPARAYADEVGMALFTYDPTGRIVPVNAAAKRVEANGTSPAGDSPRARPRAEMRTVDKVVVDRQRQLAAERKAALAHTREQWKARGIPPKRLDLAKSRRAPSSNPSPSASWNQPLPAKPAATPPSRTRQAQQAQAVERMLALADTRRRMQEAVAARKAMPAEVRAKPAERSVARAGRQVSRLALSAALAGSAFIFGTAAFAEQSNSDGRVPAEFIVLTILLAIGAVWQFFRYLRTPHRTASDRGRV
ncbi:restriction endonuclease [Nocardia sp. NPDC056064]|uniref:restriction endonuclease n=1 Tax=Nocardia sp. NPDC056064 TaxID=3345701 RepID=UPI0035DF0446